MATPLLFPFSTFIDKFKIRITHYFRLFERRNNISKFLLPQGDELLIKADLKDPKNERFDFKSLLDPIPLNSL